MKILQIPVLVSEHIPFQPTIQELAEHLALPRPVKHPEVGQQHKELEHSSDVKLTSSHHAHNKLFAKTLFSMFTPEVRLHLKSMPKHRHLFIMGLEAHVCVLQTVLDAVNSGYYVHVLVDGIGSQCRVDLEIAIERMKQVRSCERERIRMCED